MTKKDQGYQFGESLGNLTGQASKLIGRRLQENLARAGRDISIDQWLILVLLWEQDGRRQHELAEFARRDKVMITRLIDQLENKGLVKRVTDDKDKRNKRIYLTKEAWDIRPDILEQAEITLEQASVGLSKSELDATRKVLRDIIQNLS